ncbi:integral membrane protein, partial [Aureobasidium melanogenum]
MAFRLENNKSNVFESVKHTETLLGYRNGKNTERKSTINIYENTKTFLRRSRYATRVLILLETNFTNPSKSPDTNKQTRHNQSDAKPKCSSVAMHQRLGRCLVLVRRVRSDLLRNKDGVEHTTRNTLLTGWKHRSNEEIGDGKHAISTHGVEELGYKGATPYDNPVSADAMDKQTNSNIGKSSRHRSRQETKSSTQGSIALNVLEEKVGVLLESVESSPDAKDVKAYTGESFVLPKRRTKAPRRTKERTSRVILTGFFITVRSPVKALQQIMARNPLARMRPSQSMSVASRDQMRCFNMETPLPADGSSKHTTQDHADAKTEGLGSAHHSENDVSLLAGRKDFIDETNSRW